MLVMEVIVSEKYMSLYNCYAYRQEKRLESLDSFCVCVYVCDEGTLYLFCILRLIGIWV